MIKLFDGLLQNNSLNQSDTQLQDNADLSEEQNLQEGAVCTTDDGLPGVIINGVCVASVEKEEESILAEKEEEAGENILDKYSPIGHTRAGEKTQIYDWNQTKEIPGEFFNGWTSRYTGTNFSQPETPQSYGQLPGHTNLEVYDKYNIPYETISAGWETLGSAFAPYSSDVRTSNRLLPNEYFNHNMPLSIWLNDNSVIKANTPDEFRELVLFAQENQKYLPEPYVSQKTNPVNIQSFADLQFYVEQQKKLDTPERQAYDAALLNQSRLSNYQEDIIQYKALSGNPIMVDTLQGPVTIENLADLQRLSGEQLEAAMSQIYIDEYELNPSANEKALMPRVANVYLDRLQRAQRRGIPQSDEAELKQLREKYLQSISDTLPENVTVTDKDGQEVINIGEYKMTPEGVVTPEGDTYTNLEAIDIPEIQAHLINNISDQDIKDLRLALEQQDSLTNYMVDALRKIGDSAFSRALLKKLYPEVTDEQISETFALYNSLTTEKQWWQFETGGRVRMAEKGTPLYYIQNSPFGFLVQQPQNDEEAAIGLALMSAFKVPAGEALPLLSLMPTWLRTGAALIGFDTSGAGPEYVSQFMGAIANGIKKGILKASDFAKAVADVALRKGKSPKVVAEVISEIPEIGKKEADDIVADLVQQINDPEKIVMPRTKTAKPGAILEEGMVKQADGSFSKVENVTYEKIKPGDTIPEVGSPDRIDLPNGETYIVKPKPAAKPSEAPVKPSAAAPATKETEKTVVRNLDNWGDLTQAERTAWAKDSGLKGTVGYKPRENLTPDEIAALEAKSAMGEGTESAVKTATAEAKPLSEIDQQIKDVKGRISSYWQSQGERGSLKLDSDEQAGQFYKDLVELAGLYVKKGAKTVAEFAEMAGLEVNSAVKAAWKAAMGEKGAIAEFQNLPDGVKKALPNTKMYLQRNWTPPEQTAVDRLKSLSDQFDNIWNRISAERQADLAKKARKLAQAQESGAGVDVIGKSREALRGSLTDIGIEPEKMPITPEDLNVLIDVVRVNEDVTVFEKYVAENALYRLVNDYRIPRPFEVKVLKNVFGQDAINLFKLADKPRIGDYLTEIYYNSLITVKSSIPNFVGNTIATLFSPLERLGAGMIEKPLAKAAGRAPQRFVGEAAQDLFGMWSGIPEGVRAFLNTMKTGEATTLLKGEIGQQAFKGTPGAIINFNTRLLTAGDQLYRTINSAAALRAEAYRMAKLEKLTGPALQARVNELIYNPTEELLSKAAETATYRLYQDPTKLSNILLAIRNIELGKGIQPFRLILPFVRTPVNLVKFGLERSPAGLLNYKMWGNLIKGKPEAAEQLSRAIIGSLISAGIVIYASDGKITGAAPTSSAAAKDAFYREGKQPYSIKIGDKWISYQRLEPFNQIFLQAANFVEAFNNKESNEGLDKLASNMLTSFGKNLVSQNFLTGLSDAINAIGDPDRYGESWLQRVLTGAFPGSGTLRIAAQSIDNTIRQPQNLGESIESIIPGLSQNVQPRLNVFGEPQERETPAIIPYTWRTEKDTLLNRVLDEAGVEPGFSGTSITVNGKLHKLDEDELFEYRELTGEIMKQRLEQAVNGGMRNAESLERVITQARNEARQQMIRQLRQKR